MIATHAIQLGRHLMTFFTLGKDVESLPWLKG